MPGIDHDQLVKLTEKLHLERSLDFRGYKPSSLSRRVQRRLDVVKCDDIISYMEFLDRRPDEYAKLIDSILINVTEFFRDVEAWEIIRGTVIPQIMEGKKPGDQIRIWSAGCATGEEPYSLAMMLADVVGDRISEYDVRIYATDIDDQALATARRATYADTVLEAVPHDVLERHFTKNGQWAVNRDIRKMVMFGRHNLVTDAPISHVDLITCRNVLIYMAIELQNRLLHKFHYGLEPRGFLFLGKAESLLSASKIFGPINERWRVFRKDPPLGATDQAIAEQQRVGRAAEIGGAEFQFSSMFNDAVLRHSPVGIIAMDDKNTIRVLNRAAEAFWGIRASDLIGRSILEVELPYPIQQILPQIANSRSLQRESVIEELDLGQVRGKPLQVRVTFSPMQDVRGNRLGAVIMTQNITAQVELRSELEASNEQTLAANEELETTNEELQSTNEELETTNEELQSINEELETANEELQSTNEELSTTNDELEIRTSELDRVGLFFSSVVNSLDIPIVTMDESHMVTAWNPAAEAFYGLEARDALNKSFLELPIPVRDARTREKLIRLRETGKSFRSRPIPYLTMAGEERQALVEYQPLIGARGDYKGAICLVKDSASEALRPASPL